MTTTHTSASSSSRGGADTGPGVAAVPPQPNTPRAQPKRRNSKPVAGGMSHGSSQKRRRSSQHGFRKKSEVAEGDRDLVAALLRQSPATTCRICKTELRVCYLDTTQMMMLCPAQGCGFPFRAADMEAFMYSWHDEHSHRDQDEDPLQEEEPPGGAGAGASTPTAIHSKHQPAAATDMGSPGGAATQNDILDGINDMIANMSSEPQPHAIAGSTLTMDAALAPAPGPTPAGATAATTAVTTASPAVARGASSRASLQPPTEPKKGGWSMDSQDDWL